MTQIYCGNNNNHPSVLSGTHRIGTNYECLRKGIGVGSHLPYDEDYNNQHVPVDNRKYYCGNEPQLPVGGGHFAIGSPSKCLAVGIGVGKAQKARVGPPRFMYFIRYILPYVLFFLISGGIFCLFYFLKPKFITMVDYNGNIVIDWNKFTPYYSLCCLIIAICIWIFWNKFVRKWI
jgi:hypothetical protein